MTELDYGIILSIIIGGIASIIYGLSEIYKKISVIEKKLKIRK